MDIKILLELSNINFEHEKINNEDKSNKKSNNKLVLLNNNTIKHLTIKEIEKAKKTNKKSTQIFSVIIKKLHDSFEGYNGNGLDSTANRKMLENLQWIDEKIDRHNVKVNSSYLRIYNFFLKLFGKV